MHNLGFQGFIVLTNESLHIQKTLVNADKTSIYKGFYYFFKFRSVPIKAFVLPIKSCQKVVEQLSP